MTVWEMASRGDTAAWVYYTPQNWKVTNGALKSWLSS